MLMRIVFTLTYLDMSHLRVFVCVRCVKGSSCMCLCMCSFFPDLSPIVHSDIACCFFTSLLQEVDLNKKKPLFIKAKEKTSHMNKKLEAGK